MQHIHLVTHIETLDEVMLNSLNPFFLYLEKSIKIAEDIGGGTSLCDARKWVQAHKSVTLCHVKFSIRLMTCQLSFIMMLISNAICQ